MPTEVNEGFIGNGISDRTEALENAIMDNLTQYHMGMGVGSQLLGQATFNRPAALSDWFTDRESSYPGKSTAQSQHRAQSVADSIPWPQRWTDSWRVTVGGVVNPQSILQTLRDEINNWCGGVLD